MGLRSGDSCSCAELQCPSRCFEQASTYAQTGLHGLSTLLAHGRCACIYVYSSIHMPSQKNHKPEQATPQTGCNVNRPLCWCLGASVGGCSSYDLLNRKLQCKYKHLVEVGLEEALHGSARGAETINQRSVYPLGMVSLNPRHPWMAQNLLTSGRTRARKRLGVGTMPQSTTTTADEVRNTLATPANQQDPTITRTTARI